MSAFASKLLNSILRLSAKSSTKNPDLNLFKPWASWICKVWVFNSSKLNEVTVSNVSILSSNSPISFMVNLLLSITLTSASSGLKR